MMNIPIFNLLGTDSVAQVNAFFTIMVMAVGLIGLLIAIAVAADSQKFTADRKLAGQAGIFVLVGEVCLLLVGLFPIVAIIAVILIVANVINMFTCAFGKPLW